MLVASEHKHLAKTKIFWCALLVPILMGGLLGILVGYNSQVGKLCFSSECVQNFFTVFKFPVAIMGLSLPLVAMVAAIHRSIEASAQIEVATKQFGEAIANNRFGNYLKHREGFEKLIDGYCARRHFKNGCKVYVLAGNVYSRFFPDASLSNVEWNGQFDTKYFERMESHFSVLVEELKKTKEDFDFERFMGALSTLVNIFSVNYTDVSSISFEGGEGKSSVKVLIPKSDHEARGVYGVLRDIFGVLILVRGYSGVNKASGFPIAKKYGHVAELLKYSSSKYKISGLE